MYDNRTIIGKIANLTQVSGDLDQCGFGGSKLWNVGLYYSKQRWAEDG